jgi:hypothetical protein
MELEQYIFLNVFMDDRGYMTEVFAREKYWDWMLKTPEFSLDN